LFYFKKLKIERNIIKILSASVGGVGMRMDLKLDAAQFSTKINPNFQNSVFSEEISILGVQIIA
jgi:hypothetical protein